MLMGLRQALVTGTSFPVTLTFAKAGTVTVTATVQAAGATMRGMHHSSMGNMEMHGPSTGGSVPK